MINSLIEESINYNNIGDYNRDILKINVCNPILNKNDLSLTIDIETNFIIPFNDILRIKAMIKNAAKGVSKVNINCKYIDLIQSEEDIIRLAIEYILDKAENCVTGMTRTIRTDDYIVKDGEVTFYALGEKAVESLNNEMATLFENELKKTFGVNKKINFKNDDVAYNNLIEQLKQEETAALQQHANKLKAAAENAGLIQSKNEDNASKTSKGEDKIYGWNPNGNKGSQNNGGWKKRVKYEEVNGNIILGNDVDERKFISISSISSESGKVCFGGIIFKLEHKVTKKGHYLATILVTDNKGTAGVKFFTSQKKWNDIEEHLSTGDYVKIEGDAEYDEFEKEVVVRATSIVKGEFKAPRSDNSEKKRVELHAHTKMSAMDGLNDADQIVKTAARWGQPAVAITDHGVVQSFPDAASAAKKLKEKGKEIKVIYGVEGYVFDDTDCINEDGSIDYKKKKTNHIILLAKTQEGLKNLYKLVSLSHINYFYKRPRLPKSIISKYREGIIIGGACEAGEVYRAILDNKPQDEIEKIASFYDYLEIQPLINNRFLIEKENLVDNQEGLKEINKKIVSLADKLGKPVVATTDAHYAEPEDAIYRNILFAGQGYKDAESGEGLYLRTTDEMLEEFSYLGEETAFKVVVENTQLIADMIDEILPVPKGKFPPKIEGSEDRLRKTCMEKAYSMYGNPLPEEIEKRLSKELESIIGNGYAVMYVSAQLLVQKSLEDGYLVGSRGSVGSSLAATMAGITEVNPLAPHYICPKCKNFEWGDAIHGKGLYDCGVDMPNRTCEKCGTLMKKDGYTIPFETFLGFDGDKEPDIDLNFAGEYQGTAHKFVGEIFGEENVFKAGTVGTVATKTAFGFVKKFYAERGTYVNKYEVERLVEQCTGVKRTTGQHPGGMIIVPRDHEIYEFCPVQHPANDTESDIITTHFDYHKIDQNLLKLDILGHDVPSMIRQLQELTGVEPDSIPFDDDKVMAIFNGVETLSIKDPEYRFRHGSYAIPEFGTSFVRKMLDDTKPNKIGDLVRISGFSHGTDVWLNNAQEFILSGQATMNEVISTRDDIMNYLILNGLPNKSAFQIMEKVRKGKGVSEEQEALMLENNIPEWYIESCKRIKYMFPRAHAVAYVMMSYRLAWFKVYYPEAFYATYFTTKVADFNSNVILAGAKSILENIDTINANTQSNEASAKDGALLTVYEVAYEMLARGYEFTPAKLGVSTATKFGVYEGKVILPFVALEGVGETAAKSFVDEYEKAPYKTIEDIRIRAGLNKNAVNALKEHGVLQGLSETDQLSFF